MKLDEVAEKIIDLVEETIRTEFPEIDTIAEEYTVDDYGETEYPHTLLYGETYYDLENKIVEILRGLKK